MSTVMWVHVTAVGSGIVCAKFRRPDMGLHGHRLPCRPRNDGSHNAQSIPSTFSFSIPPERRESHDRLGHYHIYSSNHGGVLWNVIRGCTEREYEYGGRSDTQRG